MKKNIFFIIALFCCVLSWPSTNCNAQVFTKAARTAVKCLSNNKAILGANAVRGYSIQEHQRRQIAQSVARQALQSTSHLNAAAVAKASTIVANKKSALQVSPRLHDMTKLPKETMQNDSTLFPILPTMSTDTTSVVNKGNH